jgi:hypothetical protein
MTVDQIQAVAPGIRCQPLRCSWSEKNSGEPVYRCRIDLDDTGKSRQIKCHVAYDGPGRNLRGPSYADAIQIKSEIEKFGEPAAKNEHPVGYKKDVVHYCWGSCSKFPELEDGARMTIRFVPHGVKDDELQTINYNLHR